MTLPRRQYGDTKSEEPPDDRSSVTMWYPEVILFGPGGVRGFLELGAAVPLEEYGFFQHATVLSGVSVGAIIALLLVAGYTVREIITVAVDTEIFRGFESFSIKDIINHVVSHTGLVSSSSIRTKLNDLIMAKFGCIPNLYQLYIATGKILVTLSFDLDEEIGKYMSPETTPNISCIDAVMLSINIPFVFHRMTHDDRTFVDGALINSYPVDYFDDGKTNILGISVKCCYGSVSPTTRYIYKVIHSGMDQMRYRMIAESSDYCRHLELSSSIMDVTGLAVNNKTKASMVVEGYNAAYNFLVSLQQGAYQKPVVPPKLIRKSAPYYYLTHPDEDEQSPKDQ